MWWIAFSGNSLCGLKAKIDSIHILERKKTEKASSSNTLVQFMNNFVTFHLCKLGRIAPNNPLVLEQFAIWIEIEKELKLYFCDSGEIHISDQKTEFSKKNLLCKV